MPMSSGDKQRSRRIFEIVISMGYIHSKTARTLERGGERREEKADCTGEVEDRKTDVWKNGDAQHSAG